MCSLKGIKITKMSIVALENYFINYKNLKRILPFCFLVLLKLQIYKNMKSKIVYLEIPILYFTDSIVYLCK